MHTDFFGKEIKLGDRVVWSYGNTTSMAAAYVTKITSKSVYISRRTPQEEAAADYKWHHKLTPDRMVVIPPDWEFPS